MPSMSSGSVGTKSRVPQLPPKKRVRISNATASTVTVRSGRRRIGKLSDIMSMPVDVFAEVRTSNTLIMQARIVRLLHCG